MQSVETDTYSHPPEPGVAPQGELAVASLECPKCGNSTTAKKAALHCWDTQCRPVCDYVGCGRLFNSEKSVSAHARRAHAKRYHQVITEYNKQAGLKWSAVWKDFEILEVVLKTLELEEKIRTKKALDIELAMWLCGSQLDRIRQHDPHRGTRRQKYPAPGKLDIRQSKLCERCHMPRTLSQLLQACPRNHQPRIVRHNHVASYVQAHYTSESVLQKARYSCLERRGGVGARCHHNAQ